MICKNCGANNADNARYCVSCGTELSQATPQNNNAGANYNQNAYDYNQQNAMAAQADKKATIALVCGIIGLFCGGIIFGIVALVQANSAKRLGCNNGKVTAGFILGIIAIIDWVISTIISYTVLIPMINEMMNKL